MTERDIRKYINRLNNGKYVESIFTRQISANVDVAKVWSEQPKVSDRIIGNFDSYRFFFIKNASGRYIGAVLDMYEQHDLHWYMMPRYRKKGYLSKALKGSILPYIFNDGREFQRITIERDFNGEQNYLDSKGVATNLGFKLVKDSETDFILTRDDFDWSNENLKEVNTPVSSERFELLRQRAYFAYKSLFKISDELLMSTDDDKNLRKVAEDVKQYTWKIQDIEWEQDV